jgi:hypothetical protein
MSKPRPTEIASSGGETAATPRDDVAGRRRDALAEEAGGIAALRQVMGLVLGQLGAVTALAFYFGSVHTNAYLRYFGLNTSVVSFATADYVLRSVGPVFWPLMWLGLFVVVALAVHPLIRRMLDARPKTRGRWLGGAALVGVALLAVAAAGLFQVWIFPPSVPVIPLLITGGVAIPTYSAALYASSDRRGPTLLRRAQFVALSGLIAGGVFWAWGSYVSTLGTAAARDTAANLAYHADVSVFSAQRLVLNGHGIQADPIGDEDSLYRFRYTGLRLLVRSDDRYFLLPKEWRRGEDPVIVLSESDEVRLQFVAPPYP